MANLVHRQRDETRPRSRALSDEIVRARYRNMNIE